MRSGENLSDLVGKYFDAQSCDETRHDRARKEVGKERQTEEPKDEENQRAHHRQRKGVLQAEGIPGHGEGHEGGPD
jgi:hypothetical protein